MIFERLHCYEITPVKKYNKPLLQKNKTKIFDQKIFHELVYDLLKSNEKKDTGVLSLNQNC